jgi:superfamily II DNA/RNA helicase
MKGIAITLATRADGEAIDRIEKLIGHKIPRTGGEALETAETAKPAKREKRAKAEKLPTRTASEEAKPRESARERSPVVEDISNEWNGPLPSFLSVSAG